MQIPKDTNWCTSGFITVGSYKSKVGLNSRERLMDYKGMWYRTSEKFIHLINMWNAIDHLDLDKLNSYTWQCMTIFGMLGMRKCGAHFLFKLSLIFFYSLPYLSWFVKQKASISPEKWIIAFSWKSWRMVQARRIQTKQMKHELYDMSAPQAVIICRPSDKHEAKHLVQRK